MASSGDLKNDSGLFHAYTPDLVKLKHILRDGGGNIHPSKRDNSCHQNYYTPISQITR